MTCPECNIDMTSQNSTLEHPYNYDLSGIDNVHLAGIVVFHCPKCKFGLPLIPKVQELHDAMSNYILQKESSLTGDEIRFIRKHLGFTQEKFAELIETSEDKLRYIEENVKGTNNPMKLAFFMDRWVWT
jgi:putative transcriptional regulator